MEIIFVGTGVGVPSLKRASPAIIVKIKNSTILIDSGPGTVRKMIEAGFSYLDIDYILYTHTHVDHICDLGAFLFASKNPFALKKGVLKLVGPNGFRAFYHKLLDLYGDQIVSDSLTIEISEMKDSEASFEDFKISTKPMIHMEGSIAYRIEDSIGKAVVYSGDTEYNQEIVELAKGSDVLILECSFPDAGKVEGHLTPRVCGKIAKEGNSKKLILTHLYPICEDYDILGDCKKIFDGKVTIAEDLMRIAI